jgi:hypothetical protein
MSSSSPLHIAPSPISVSQVFETAENGKIQVQNLKVPSPEELKALRDKILQEVMANFQGPQELTVPSAGL